MPQFFFRSPADGPAVLTLEAQDGPAQPYTGAKSVQVAAANLVPACTWKTVKATEDKCADFCPAGKKVLPLNGLVYIDIPYVGETNHGRGFSGCCPAGYSAYGGGAFYLPAEHPLVCKKN